MLIAEEYICKFLLSSFPFILILSKKTNNPHPKGTAIKHLLLNDGDDMRASIAARSNIKQKSQLRTTKHQERDNSWLHDKSQAKHAKNQKDSSVDSTFFDSTWRHHVVKDQRVWFEGDTRFVHEAANFRHCLVDSCLLARRHSELRQVVGDDAALAGDSETINGTVVEPNQNPNVNTLQCLTWKLELSNQHSISSAFHFWHIML